MNLLPKDSNGCPYLFLAPMEGVGDRYFRHAMTFIGGFDEAVTEFLRVPTNANVKSLARAYDPSETFPIPLAPQIMGSDPGLMAAMALEIESRGAPRIDINCGCPSNTVTGRAAGSSLLKDPLLLHDLVKTIVDAVAIPVTLKLRSGFLDTALFKENMLASQEGGASYVCLHPRTKVEGYKPPARWDLIAEAKSLLSIPVVGNGDLLSVDDALQMLKQTKCDALMIGRGSIMNPFIFQQIRAHFAGKNYQPNFEDLHTYLKVFIDSFTQKSPQRLRINKLKQLMGFIFKGNQALLEKRKEVLAYPNINADDYFNFLTPILKMHWQP